ncbi:MAG: polysaccharide deacetylase family protein [Acidobacteria bacterium]|nr:polysaccharide deacetylase family protein [Acidobacteriota bacterium]
MNDRRQPDSCAGCGRRLIRGTSRRGLGRQQFCSSSCFQRWLYMNMAERLAVYNRPIEPSPPPRPPRVPHPDHGKWMAIAGGLLILAVLLAGLFLLPGRPVHQQKIPPEAGAANDNPVDVPPQIQAKITPEDPAITETTPVADGAAVPSTAGPHIHSATATHSEEEPAAPKIQPHPAPLQTETPVAEVTGVAEPETVGMPEPLPTSFADEPVNGPTSAAGPGGAPDLLPTGFTPRMRAIMIAENPYHIMRGALDLPYVCLTFDGSALDNGTGPILRILHEKDVAATFFLSGEFLENFPEKVQAIAGDGHEVGSHLYRHVHLTTWEENRRHDLRPEINRARVHELLQRNEILFTAIVGEPMSKIWRAPYGETNRLIDAWAGAAGYLHVGWTRDYARGKSMDALDWISRPEADGYLTAAQIRDRLLAFDGEVPGGANGAIILLHLGTQRREEQPWLVLEEIIDGFRSKGYSFVTVSQLIRETVRLAEQGLPPLVNGMKKNAVPSRTPPGTSPDKAPCD